MNLDGAFEIKYGQQEVGARVTGALFGAVQGLVIGGCPWFWHSLTSKVHLNSPATATAITSHHHNTTTQHRILLR
ncbi:predicted protein [Histoplasma capsulatum H143]|uniref:Uncharacterized protein n=1 Tax=Ajellomyces capsulatus (strain H143) TaxID=544712 RepID=C6H7T2_AJECH|nr:predicted protein [Histoplasma capsulatum H143]